MENKKTKEIQTRISEERKKQGYSFRKFAKMIGYTARAVSYWETGQRTINIDAADKALKALGLTVTLGK